MSNPLIELQGSNGMRSNLIEAFGSKTFFVCLKSIDYHNGNRTFRHRRFGKKNPRRFGKFFMPKRPVLSWFFFGCLQTGPNQFVENQKPNQDNIPVCRILELKKNDKTIIVGMMQSIKRASDMSPFPLVPRNSLGPLIFPSC